MDIIKPVVQRPQLEASEAVSDVALSYFSGDINSKHSHNSLT